MFDSAIEILTQGRILTRLAEGLWVTLEISAVSVLLSLALGVGVGLLFTSRRRSINLPIRLYLEVIRVMPILVLLYLFYYFPARNWDINLESKVVAVLVFTLWGTAEMADLVRGALTSIAVHQRESGRAVGLTEAQINRYIIVPQAVRRLAPGVINLTTRMIKTTPFVFFINVPELVKVGQQVIEWAAKNPEFTASAKYMASFWVYGFVFFLYFIICYPVSLYSRYLEKNGAREGNPEKWPFLCAAPNRRIF